MNKKVNNRFKKTAIIFSLLLFYIVAALVWWFISLEKQNDAMFDYKIHQTEIKIKADNDRTAYKAERRTALNEHRRNRVKYAGEGIVFLGLILLGAFYIYRSLQQQIRMQRQQQNFMMAVTHELKTPIAVSRLNLETLLKHSLDEDRQKKMIKTTLDETKRLDFLTNNILVSSQLESRGYKINKEELDFSNLLLDRIKEFRARFTETDFVEAIDEDSEVKGDPLLLQILVNNLLENAVKYAEKNSTISINLYKTADEVTMSIADDGPGVPDDEKKNIFTKFYRIGNEATRKTKGTGLGLYLCKKIATDHNADISVTDNKPKGSIFVVTFKNKVV